MSSAAVRVYFVAEWPRDDVFKNDGVERDRLDQSTHDDFDEAKDGAMSKALDSPMYWARVTRVEEVNGRKEYGPQFVNEWISGDWTGWYPKEDEESVRLGH